MKKCPYCAEDVQDEALKCKHCQSSLPVLKKSKPIVQWKIVKGTLIACGILLAIGIITSVTVDNPHTKTSTQPSAQNQVGSSDDEKNSSSTDIIAQKQVVQKNTVSKKPVANTAVSASIFSKSGEGNNSDVGPFTAPDSWKLEWNFNCPDSVNGPFAIDLKNQNGAIIKKALAANSAFPSKYGTIYVDTEGVSSYSGQGTYTLNISVPDPACTWKVNIKTSSAPKDGSIAANDLWLNTATPEDKDAALICYKTNWTKSTCRRLANKEYWVGMTVDMLKASLGYPDQDNLSNYGDGDEHQYCYTDPKISCFYADTKGIIYAYN